MAELLDFLDADNLPANFCNVTVVPESEKKAHDTDCDSDGSNDEVACDYKRLPSRLLKGEGLISDNAFQLPLLDMADVLECPAALVSSSTEPNIINAVEEKENSPTTPGPMLMKIKNKEWRQIPKKQYRLSVINSLPINPSQPIPSSHQMIQQTSFSHSIPNHYRISPWKSPPSISLMKNILWHFFYHWVQLSPKTTSSLVRRE